MIPDEIVEAALDLSTLRPAFFAYTIPTQDLTNTIMSALSEAVGEEVLEYLSSDLHDEDFQYLISCDVDEMEEDGKLELLLKLSEYLGVADLEDSYEITNHLVRKIFVSADYRGWTHVQGYYDSRYVDVQISFPK